MIKNWMRGHLVGDNICNIINLQCPKPFTLNDKYVRFSCNVEPWQIELVTLNTIVNTIPFESQPTFGILCRFKATLWSGDMDCIRAR